LGKHRIRESHVEELYVHDVNAGVK